MEKENEILEKIAQEFVEEFGLGIENYCLDSNKDILQATIDTHSVFSFVAEVAPERLTKKFIEEAPNCSKKDFLVLTNKIYGVMDTETFGSMLIELEKSDHELAVEVMQYVKAYNNFLNYVETSPEAYKKVQELLVYKMSQFKKEVEEQKMEKQVVLSQFERNMAEDLGYTDKEVDELFSNNRGYWAGMLNEYTRGHDISWVGCIPEDMSYDERDEFITLLQDSRPTSEGLDLIADIMNYADDTKNVYLLSLAEDMYEYVKDEVREYESLKEKADDLYLLDRFDQPEMEIE